MKTVTVRKDNLAQILIKNRTEHRDVFTAAQAKYRETLKEVLQDELAKLVDNKPVDLAKITCLIVPRNFTKDYDRAILMLDMETATTVTLDEVDFRQLVQDEWSWSHQWAVSNASYTSSPKFQQHLGDE